jgi:hypothetical protein
MHSMRLQFPRIMRIRLQESILLNFVSLAVGAFGGFYWIRWGLIRFAGFFKK